MRLEDCIRWRLAVFARRVTKVVETQGRLVAQVEAVQGRQPQCGACGQKVGRTKGVTRRRGWRDLLIRRLPRQKGTFYFLRPPFQKQNVPFS